MAGNNRRILLLIGAVILLSTTGLFAEVSYKGNGLRDPFVDPAGAFSAVVAPDPGIENAVKALKLQGVMYSTDNPRAFISGKIYSIGDEIGALKVANIEREGVKLSAGGKEYVLKQTPRKTSDDF